MAITPGIMGYDGAEPCPVPASSGFRLIRGIFASIQDHHPKHTFLVLKAGRWVEYNESGSLLPESSQDAGKISSSLWRYETMIKRGPVDMLVLALGAPIFDGSILRELQKQSANGVIRVLDAMILFKADDGKCWSVDLEDLPEKDLDALSFIPIETRGLFDSDDAETLWEGMVPDSAVIALAIEHIWAVDLVNALDAAGVEVAMNVRIPAPIIDEALASLEA